MKYPIPEIPDDFENKSGTDRVLKKTSGSGRVSGTRWALFVWYNDWKECYYECYKKEDTWEILSAFDHRGVEPALTPLAILLTTYLKDIPVIILNDTVHWTLV